MRFLKKQKGQGLLEAVLSLPLFIAAGTILGLMLYRCLIFYLAEYHLHEALICSEFEKTQACENNLDNKLRKFLPQETALQIRLPRTSHKKLGEVAIALKPPLKVKLQLQIPNKISPL